MRSMTTVYQAFTFDIDNALVFGSGYIVTFHPQSRLLSKLFISFEAPEAAKEFAELLKTKGRATFRTVEAECWPSKDGAHIEFHSFGEIAHHVVLEGFLAVEFLKRLGT